MTTLGTATLKLRMDSSSLDRGLDQAQRNSESKFKAIGDRAGRLGKVLAGIGAPIVAAIGLAVNASSNLEESVNAVNVVFEEGAALIHAFGETSSTSVGLARAEFNQLAAVTGALFTNFGLSEEEAAERTIELTKRAADLASVFNVDVQDALGALSAGIRGETEPLRRFAADVTDATLQQYLLAQGIDTSVMSMTQAEKGLLRFEVAMSQTEKVQGDFQNTSDSLANSLRIGRAEFTDSAAELGNIFLPLLASVTGKVAGLIKGIREWAQENPRLFKTIVIVTTVIGGLALALGGLLIVIGLLLPAIIAIGGPVILVTALIGLLIAAGVAVAANWDWVREHAAALWNRIGGVVERAINIIIDILNIFTFVQRQTLAKLLRGASEVAQFFGVEMPAAVDKFINAVEAGIPHVDIWEEKTERLVEQAETHAAILEEEAESVEKLTRALSAQNDVLEDELIPSLDEGIGRRKLDLEQLERLNEIQEAALADRVDAQREHGRDLEDARLRLARQLEDIERDSGRRRTKLLSDQLEEVADLEEEHAQEIADLRAEASDKAADLSEALADDRLDVQQDYAEDREAAQKKFDDRLLDLSEKLAEDRVDAERDYALDLADIDRDLQRDREDALQDHLERLASIRQRAVQDQQDAELDRNRDIEDINREFERDLAEARRRIAEDFFDDPNIDIASMVSRAGADTALVQANRDALTELTRRRDQALQDLGIDHARTLEDIAIEQQRSVEEQELAHQANLASIEEEARQKRSDRTAQHLEKLSQLEVDFVRRREDAQETRDEAELLAETTRAERLRELRAQHEEDLLELNKDYDGRETTLRAAQQVERLRQVGEHDQELAGLEAAAQERREEAQRGFQERVEDLDIDFQREAEDRHREHLENLTEIAEEWGATMSARVRRALAVANLTSAGTTGAGRPSPLTLDVGAEGLAMGGIVRRPMFAALAEEGNPEAVIPLDRLGELGGRGLTLSFAGATIYGFDDFSDKVNEAFLQRGLRGREDRPTVRRR